MGWKMASQLLKKSAPALNHAEQVELTLSKLFILKGPSLLSYSMFMLSFSLSSAMTLSAVVRDG